MHATVPTLAAAPTEAPPARRRPPLAAPARWLVASSAVSSTGTGLTNVALPLLVAARTRSPIAVSAVAVAEYAPWLLLGMPLGCVADRLPRLRAMVAVDIARAVAIAALGLAVVLGVASPVAVCAAAFLLGAGETLFSSCAQATIPAVVDDASLDRANGLLVAGQIGGQQCAGPLVAGVMFAAAPALPVFGDAVSFVVSAGCLRKAAAAAPPTQAPPAVAAEPAPRGSVLSDLRSDMAAGWSAFRGNAVLVRLAVVLGALALCQAVAIATLPLFGLRVLGLGPAGVGLLMAAASAGSLAGAIATDRLTDRWPAWTILVAGAIAAAGAYLVLGSTRRTAIAVAALAVEAFAVGCGSVASISLRQRAVPAHLLGRVSGLFRAIVWGLVPVGSVTGGVLASRFGLRAPLLAAGVAQALVVGVVALTLRGATPATPPAPAEPARQG